MMNSFNRKTLLHDSDPSLGIDSFAPEFWRLVGQPLQSSPSSTPDEQPLASPPPFSEESPEDRSRREMYGRLRTQPLYKGEPSAAQVLPPAREGEILSIQRPDPKESALIVKNIKELRERLPRMEEYQRKGLGDSSFDKEIDSVRRQLKEWEKALAARAETGA